MKPAYKMYKILEQAIFIDFELWRVDLEICNVGDVSHPKMEHADWYERTWYVDAPTEDDAIETVVNGCGNATRNERCQRVEQC